MSGVRTAIAIVSPVVVRSKFHHNTGHNPLIQWVVVGENVIMGYFSVNHNLCTNCD